MQVDRAGRGDPAQRACHLLWLLWLIGLGLLLSATARAAEPQPGAAAKAVGEVIFVEGIASAQLPGATPRFLQKGEPLFEGETVSTGAQGFAIIGFTDGTKFTLRPNTSFQIDRFRHGGGTDSAIFRLLKGGMRAVTGLISKRDPKAMEVNAVTATIGIRGTSFDARICAEDCAEEQRRSGRKPPQPRPDLVVARAAVVVGSAQAVGASGASRQLVEGSALFTGDTVRTSKASQVLIAFRDRSKVTVIADSEFKLEDVNFSPKGETGNFAVRILRGGVRAVTGLLGKNNPKAVNFNITTVVIGIRGSAFDTYAGQVCVADGKCGEGVGTTVRSDGINMTAGDQTIPLDANESGAFLGGQLSRVDTAQLVFPQPDAMIPENQQVDFEALFRTVELDRLVPGLYAGILDGDGEIVVSTAQNAVHLAGNQGAVVYPDTNVVERIEPNWAAEVNRDLSNPATFVDPTQRTLLKQESVICVIR
ncbi:MAG TPA: FecR domain-containing protein [Burkholderiales bacterium]|nr:FecR domain-containing protein [Burkholderiales bacterium]